ncbi:hypothetical protein AB4Z51_38835 [Bradyrhizobium sp. 2TAF36]|nr:hypothetical protein [Bradyrhizobium sp. MOS001]
MMADRVRSPAYAVLRASSGRAPAADDAAAATGDQRAMVAISP